MKNIINGTFVNFLSGFIIILSISLGLVLVINFYEVTAKSVAQSAAALLFLK
tara:strand:+ start:5176 stop:5331 length:156 start_codon:yes stop_codon:yes gene_type:complete